MDDDDQTTLHRVVGEEYQTTPHRGDAFLLLVHGDDAGNVPKPQPRGGHHPTGMAHHDACEYPRRDDASAYCVHATASQPQNEDHQQRRQCHDPGRSRQPKAQQDRVPPYDAVRSPPRFVRGDEHVVLLDGSAEQPVAVRARPHAEDVECHGQFLQPVDLRA